MPIMSVRAGNPVSGYITFQSRTPFLVSMGAPPTNSRGLITTLRSKYLTSYTGVYPAKIRAMEQTLKGKVAIVTGASSGIGEATARALAERGAAVLLAARNEEKLRFLEREILAGGGRALAVRTDIADEASVEAMVERAVGEFGSVDILVNNAGLGLSGRVEDLRVEDLCYLFEVNVFGPLRCLQAVLPYMRRGGRIINISSVVGKRAIP